MKYKKRQKQIFFDGIDERLISELVVDEIPTVQFVDDNVWDSPEPTLRDSIADCSSSFCYLWNLELVSELSIIALENGRYQGPAADQVIQVIRCRLRDEQTLLSGRIAASYQITDTSNASFVSKVFKLAANFGHFRTCSIDVPTGRVIHPNIAEYIVGSHAAQELSNGELTFLKDRSTENYYRPIDGNALVT